MGTASADKTARIWGVDSGRCLTLYTGHTGSVNAIAFHPTQDLVLTASGDASAHIWKAAPILPESVLSGTHQIILLYNNLVRKLMLDTSPKIMFTAD